MRAPGFTVAALVALALALPSTPATAQLLRIATEGAYPPWNNTDATGTLTGFEVDLVRDLCRRLETVCEIVSQDWDGILPGLQQGKYDAVAAGVSITDERLKTVAFTQPYAADPAVFAVAPNSPLVAVLPAGEKIDLDGVPLPPVVLALAEALAGKTVGVQSSTTHARLMEALFPGVTIRTYEKFEYAVLDLAAGRVDVLLGARSATDAARKSGTDIVLVGPSFARGVLGRGVGLAVRKGDELVSRFSIAITAAVADGTVAALSQQWFGYDVSLP